MDKYKKIRDIIDRFDEKPEILKLNKILDRLEAEVFLYNKRRDEYKKYMDEYIDLFRKYMNGLKNIPEKDIDLLKDFVEEMDVSVFRI